MIESIITALITGSISLVGVVLTVNASNSRMYGQLQTNQAVTEEKLKAIDEKLNKHDKYSERFDAIEKDVSYLMGCQKTQKGWKNE